jgi:hypothetical protein
VAAPGLGDGGGIVIFGERVQEGVDGC